MKHKKTRWLNTIVFPCHVAICLCEREYLQLCKEFKYEWPFVSNPQSDATMHTMQTVGGLRCVITLKEYKKRPKDQVYGILIHEAVHIVQRIGENIGEEKWGIETQAYLTQCIAQWLMWNFDELCKIK